MGPITLSLAVLISICAALCAVACAVACWRVVSEYSSLTKRLKLSAESVESFNSRITELETKWEGLAKRTHLNARRDPETGKSMRVHPPKVETKEDVRRRLGLVGSNAARVAHAIHATGGIRQ
jgi:uncharacterized protein YoxC